MDRLNSHDGGVIDEESSGDEDPDDPDHIYDETADAEDPYE